MREADIWWLSMVYLQFKKVGLYQPAKFYSDGWSKRVRVSRDLS